MEKKIQQYVNKWEARCYKDGIPDEAPKEIDEMVPSYKRICMALMRGDVKMLGITPPISQWYDHYKKIELNERHQRNIITNGTMEETI